MAEEAVVLYPSPAIGHLIAMVELGRLILTHRPSLSIHIVLPPAPYQADATAPYLAAVSASTPSITFHRLPPPPATALSSLTSTHLEFLMLETLRLSHPRLRLVLESMISKSVVVHALIIDFFCTAALSVAAELNIPCYNFSTSGAACLAFTLHFPTLHKAQTKSFRELGRTVLEIPGAPRLPASEAPKILFDRNDALYGNFLKFTKRLPESAGLIVNTFDALESEAVRAISAGLCVSDRPTPPLYCIGPLIGDGGGRKENTGSGADCLSWLDSQPKRSVVFLCFGSLGIFSKEQLGEIAVGLEKSGQRFLWVVRDPPSGDKRNVDVLVKDQELSLEGLLPDGFLERTRGKGHVVKSWAPQVEVLGHGSVGGFVTHCGWNSVLEAVRAGVPMVAWPLYAEQRFNRVLLVEEIRIALPMVERDDESEFVEAVEVERRVKELMETEGSGELVRRRMIEMKNAAEDALSDGGSSRVGLARLVDSWKSK